jgi:dUTPase
MTQNFHLSEIITSLSIDGVVKSPTIDQYKYAIDLYSPINASLYKDAVINIPSKVIVNVPAGHIAQLIPAGKLAKKAGVVCPASLIPHGYTAEITLSFLNTTTDVLDVKINDHVAQLIILPAAGIMY